MLFYLVESPEELVPVVDAIAHSPVAHSIVIYYWLYGDEVSRIGVSQKVCSIIFEIYTASAWVFYPLGE